MGTISNLQVFVLTSILTVIEAGEFCYIVQGGYTMCDHGCCGDSWNRRCCTRSELITGMIVLGVLLFVGAVVTVVVIICCRRRRNRMGQVIRQNGQVLVPEPQVATFNTPAAGYPYGGGYTNYAGPQMHYTNMTTTTTTQPPAYQSPPPAYETLQPKMSPSAPSH